MLHLCCCLGAALGRHDCFVRDVGASTHDVGFSGHGAVSRVCHAAICARALVLDVVAVAPAVVEIFFVLEGLGGKNCCGILGNCCCCTFFQALLCQFPLGGWML